MKVSPPPRVSALLRIFAGTCALSWFVGIAVCGLERVHNGAGHEAVCAGHPAHDHDTVVEPGPGQAQNAETHPDAEAQQHVMDSHHHDDEAQHEHDGGDKQDCDEQTCCSTMMALLPTTHPVVIANSISPQVFVFCLLNAGRERTISAPNCEAARQARPRDWVLTPEVCLGPAHRSLAPPSPA